jgi:hypothetical protein
MEELKNRKVTYFEGDRVKVIRGDVIVRDDGFLQVLTGKGEVWVQKDCVRTIKNL